MTMPVDPERERLVREKVTCPFVGAAVATGKLAVRESAANPLARIDDVKELGNSGGGDLGDVLVVFAQGNHAKMRDASGALAQPVPDGLFSLEFPGSDGSHSGDSGILQGNPHVLGSGRFSETDFQRLVARAQDGLIRRSDVGRFIAENLVRDPQSKVAISDVFELLAKDLEELVVSVVPAVLARFLGTAEEASRTHREVLEKLTAVLREDNLVGSSGEFGLLFAFFANRPEPRSCQGEPALSVDDLQCMFGKKQLPQGWETWKKTARDWIVSTIHLIGAAGSEYLRLQRATRELPSG